MQIDFPDTTGYGDLLIELVRRRLGERRFELLRARLDFFERSGFVDNGALIRTVGKIQHQRSLKTRRCAAVPSTLEFGSLYEYIFLPQA